MVLSILFILLSFTVIGFSLKNRLIIISLVIIMFIILLVFIIYMKYITKLAKKSLQNSEDFSSLQLFLNCILTSDIDLKLYIDKDIAKQIMKILNNEIYSVKDKYIYDVLDNKYTAKNIRNEILEELSCLFDKDIVEMINKAYKDVETFDTSSHKITISLLDSWCLHQLIHMKRNTTTRVDSKHYDALIFIIDNILEIKEYEEALANDSSNNYFR